MKKVIVGLTTKSRKVLGILDGLVLQQRGKIEFFTDFVGDVYLNNQFLILMFLKERNRDKESLVPWLFPPQLSIFRKGDLWLTQCS